MERVATQVTQDSALRQLGDEIATLAAQIDSATHRLLVMLAEFDRRGGWITSGHASCAHWLSWRTGVDLGAARERIRAARALEHLPKTSEAMSKGTLSYSKARALTRVATRENESELLSLAMTGSVAKVERVVRSWKRHSRLDERELERQRHESRTFSVFPDDEGMYVVRGLLDPEVGALLMRAIDAATNELYDRERREGRAGDRRSDEDEDSDARTNGGRGCHSSEDQTCGSRSDKCRSGEDQTCAARTNDAQPTAVAHQQVITLPRQRRADAIGLVAEWALGRKPDGSRAQHFQVTLHVDADTLSEHKEPGVSELEDGTRVSAETSRRLSCDAGLVDMKHGADGRILDVGRKRRTVPPAIRRALVARDRGCVFPGCGSRFTESHHARHWANGGLTRLSNLVSLCRRHHRAVHEDGYRVVMSPDERAEFYDPNGVMILEAPEGGGLAPEGVGWRPRGWVGAGDRSGLTPVTGVG